MREREREREREMSKRVVDGEGLRRKIKDKEIWRRMSRKLSGSSDEIEDVDSVNILFLFF